MKKMTTKNMIENDNHEINLRKGRYRNTVRIKDAQKRIRNKTN